MRWHMPRLEVGDVGAGDGEGVDGDFHALAFLRRAGTSGSSFTSVILRPAWARAASSPSCGASAASLVAAAAPHGHEEGGEALVALLVRVGHGDDVRELAATSVWEMSHFSPLRM